MGRVFFAKLGRFHRQLKEALRARGSSSDWLAHLPCALLGLRSAPKEEAAVSSAEVLFGQPLVLPSQVHKPSGGMERPDQAKEIPITIREEKERARACSVGIQEADYVMVREGAVVGLLDAKYRGLYRVMLRESKKLLVEMGASRQWVSVDRLKPWKGTTTASPAQPPKRGRLRTAP